MSEESNASVKSRRRWRRMGNLYLDEVSLRASDGAVVDGVILDSSRRGMQLSFLGPYLPQTTPFEIVEVWLHHRVEPWQCEVRWTRAGAEPNSLLMGVMTVEPLPPTLYPSDE